MVHTGAGKSFFIETSKEMPYYIKTSTGCEIYSNDRRLRIVASKVKIANDEQRYNIAYFVRSGEHWEKGSNGLYADSLERYISDLKNSPSFTKATTEM